MNSITTTAGATPRDLSGFEGRLIGPEDGDYDEARKVYNAMIDKRPALIARCAGPSDVAKAIAFGRNGDLPLAVRGGGHNGAGLGTCDDGVVIDLSLLSGVRVDPAGADGSGRRRLHLGRGRPRHPRASASPRRAGSSPRPASAALPSAAGIGHLTRKCGLTIDNLLEADWCSRAASVVAR